MWNPPFSLWVCRLVTPSRPVKFTDIKTCYGSGNKNSTRTRCLAWQNWMSQLWLLKWCGWLLNLYWYLTSIHSSCHYYCLPYHLHLRSGHFVWSTEPHKTIHSKWNQTLLLSFSQTTQNTTRRIKDIRYCYCLFWRESAKPLRLRFLLCLLLITSHYCKNSKQRLRVSLL